ncbi:hypothetical protein PHLGIDRAFT_408964 [Phlebiopsis gigantea 11061_1 CR5-6]|uniref:Uncharacterized protein n=1 Tax=Phlebiopsis gigantea (strain 11061_1 CR5-6) TaxID=745531 RepID=A0A0C3P8U6_PHLG1|nr:hypothetical protein PHLGIDRAFT_408964 [Phlebiopsis gigantea 11061_1 CR5-6]
MDIHQASGVVCGSHRAFINYHWTGIHASVPKYCSNLPITTVIKYNVPVSQHKKRSNTY